MVDTQWVQQTAASILVVYLARIRDTSTFEWVVSEPLVVVYGSGTINRKGDNNHSQQLAGNKLEHKQVCIQLTN